MTMKTMLDRTTARAASPLLLALAAALSAAPLVAAPAAVPQNLFQGEAREAVRLETERLAAVQARHQDSILDLPSVHQMGIAVDRASGELVFLVVAEPEIELPALPAELEGVRVVVDRAEKARAQDGGQGCVPCHANQLATPVAMGNSTGNRLFCASCTLGFKVCRDGQIYYVTNAHCSPDSGGCAGGAPMGSVTYHPGPDDVLWCTPTISIGNVSAYATPDCLANNEVDLAFVVSSDGSTSWEIRDIGVPDVFPGAAVIGDAVQKSGRTTGHTTGTVDAVNVTADVDMECCNDVRFVGQIRVVPAAAGEVISLGGDSGSALVDFAAPPQVVGLIFAGTLQGDVALANPIDAVLASAGGGFSLDPSCPASPEPCEDICRDAYNDCQEDFCYWDYDEFMCSTGCYDEYQACLAAC